MRKIRILVVDDSLFFRQMLAEVLNANPLFEVVATASDPFEARDKIIEFRPDVMTLDIELPRMNGIEFLRRLIPQYPLPTVVVSSLNVNVFDALDAGAVDFVNKPQIKSPEDVKRFVEQDLEVKIKIATTAKIANAKFKNPVSTQAIQRSSATGQRKTGIIAIGASTGGTEAIASLLSGMGNDLPGIVMTQHMPPGFTKMFAGRLNQECAMRVKEAQTGDRIEPGLALLAPGDAHMRIIKVGPNDYQVDCKPGEKVSGHCPSVDVMFESVAKTFGDSAIGILLTGMGADGAAGLGMIKKAGGITIGQDESTCVVYGMPKVAFDTGAVVHQLPLEKIANKVYQLLET